MNIGIFMDAPYLEKIRKITLQIVRMTKILEENVDLYDQYSSSSQKAMSLVCS